MANDIHEVHALHHKTGKPDAGKRKENPKRHEACSMCGGHHNGNVTTGEDDKERAYADIGLGPQNKKLTLKPDTGAQASIIPANDFATLMSNTPLMPADRMT